MTFAEYHSIFASGYSVAIAHYEQQKEYFLKQLEAGKADGAKDFLMKLNNALSTELEDNTQEIWNKYYSQVKDQVQNALIGYLNNGGQTEWSILINDIEKARDVAKREKKNVEKTMRGNIENLLTHMGFSKTGENNLASFIIQSDNLAGNKDVQQNIYGYARRIIFNSLWSGSGSNLGTANTSHFISAMQGYGREEALTTALIKILNQYRDDLSAGQAGSEAVDNIQIKQDIVIGTTSVVNKGRVLEGLGRQLQSLDGVKNATVTVSLPTGEQISGDIIATIQSKSWKVPWATKRDLSNWGLSFGSDSSYMPSNIHSWHAGAAAVMSNMIKIIGPTNLLYSTGSGIFFTSNLLAEFRDQGYVLSYYKSIKSATLTNHIVMAYHDDSVTNYNS